MKRRGLVIFICIFIILMAVILGIGIRKLIEERDLNRKAEELKGTVEVLLDRNADTIMTLADIAEPLQRASEGAVSQILVSDLTDSEALSEALDRFEDGQIYILLTSEQAGDHCDDAMMCFATEEYLDELYELYSFEDKAYLTDNALQEDLIRLKTRDYDTVFISMYDISCYKPEITREGTLWESYFTQRPLESLEYFDQYIAEALDDPGAGGIATERVILGLDPLKMLKDSDCDPAECERRFFGPICDMIASHSNVEFMVLFPGYHVSHYSVEDADLLKEAYEGFISHIEGLYNMSVHYFGNQEWILDNIHLYEEGSDICYLPRIADTLQREMITDRKHSKSADNLLACIEETADYIREYKAIEYPDLSDTCIVVLGDSIFGNYDDESSIQENIKGYTGAGMINLAIGGAFTSAKGNPPTTIAGELDDIDSLKGQISDAGCSRLIFLIEFGLNDYLGGILPYDEKDEDNLFSYYGALKDTVDKVQTNWSEAEILMLVPGWIDYGHHGWSSFREDYPRDWNLQVYRDLCIKVARESSVGCLELATETGITESNLKRYLYADMIHYNQEGRYKIAQSIISKIDCEHVD